MQKPDDSRIDCAWVANVDAQKSADLSSHEFSVKKRITQLGIFCQNESSSSLFISI